MYFAIKLPINQLWSERSPFLCQVVLIPITLGLALNTYAKPVVRIIQPVMPFVAMICTSLCIGSPLAINRAKILSMDGLQLVLPVLTFHAVAFTVGYWVSKIPSLRLIIRHSSYRTDQKWILFSQNKSFSFFPSDKRKRL